MTQVFLDGQEVVVQNKTSIKLIKENPFFTKSGSSTLGITLPMHIEQNLKVLGHLNRLDNLTTPITLSATIKSGNKTIITGEAVVTEITEKSVKVQILGGTALMNFHNKMDNIYIDELDLGKWGKSYIGDSQATNTVYPLFMYLWYQYTTVGPGYNKDNEQRKLVDALFGFNNEWVAFPIYNETSGVMCNDWIFRVDMDNGNAVWGEKGYYIEPRSNIDGYDANGYPQVRFVVQPYLLPMIKRVFEALGYSIDLSSLENNALFSKIFIASANESPYRNKALPHWTVKEFITQLENFFGATFDVNEESKRITIMRRSEYISRGVVEIGEVLDEFTTSTDDNKNALSTSNVGYSEVDPFAKIEDWILNNAQRKYYDNYLQFELSVLTYWNFSGTNDPHYYDKYKGYIMEVGECNGVCWVCKNTNGGLFTSRIIAANYLKDRIVKENNKEVDIELKIVPVKVVTDYVKVYEKDKNGKDVLHQTLKGDYYYMSAPDHPVRTWDEERSYSDESIIIDVEAAINGEGTFENGKDDLMRIAINAGAFSHHSSWTTTIEGVDTFYHKYPKPVVFSHEWENSINGTYDITKYGLNLTDACTKISLATEVFASEPKVNTNKKYCIKFITHDILNPGFKFIIRNQTYLCEKLEYQIKETGVEELVTGYFYRLEE